MEPFVYIIVLNWNNYPDTEECLTSINELEYSNSRILVVDNASTDGSVEMDPCVLHGMHPLPPDTS